MDCLKVKQYRESGLNTDPMFTYFYVCKQQQLFSSQWEAMFRGVFIYCEPGACLRLSSITSVKHRPVPASQLNTTYTSKFNIKFSLNINQITPSDVKIWVSASVSSIINL